MLTLLLCSIVTIVSVTTEILQHYFLQQHPLYFRQKSYQVSMITQHLYVIKRFAKPIK